MSHSNLKTIFVPGAWMGAWIWQPTVRSLTSRGFDAVAVTLRGLADTEIHSDIAQIRLEDHVLQLKDYVAQMDAPVILVSHSYSSMVTGQVADRLRERVAGLIHFGGFLPLNTRSLLDDWGTSDEDRQQEKTDIADAGNLWLAPERAMLEYETDLSPQDRDFLAERFTPHPGLTVTDKARMSSPVATQPTTYVALSPQGEQHAWRAAPKAAREATTWRRKHIASGHWVMLTRPEGLEDLLSDEINYYTARRKHESIKAQ